MDKIFKIFAVTKGITGLLMVILWILGDYELGVLILGCTFMLSFQIDVLYDQKNQNHECTGQGTRV